MVVPILVSVLLGLLASEARSAEFPVVVYARARVVESADSDGDTLPDATEDRYGTDKQNPDTDDDGLSDGDELLELNTDPLRADSDGDGWKDGLEVGSDANPMDPLSYPVHLYGETVYGGVQTGAVWVVAVPAVDTGLASRTRVSEDAGPFLFTNVVSRKTWYVVAWRDVEADGEWSGWEPWAASDDFTPTGTVTGVVLELADGTVDTDGNGEIDWQEFYYFGRIGINPLADSDGDRLPDGDELGRGTHPLLWDTDGDGMGDGFEVEQELDPLTADPPIVVTFDLQHAQGALIQWNTVWSRGYMPQFRDSLTEGTWSNLLPTAVYEYNEHPTGTQQVLDRDANTVPTRFYRIQRVDER